MASVKPYYTHGKALREREFFTSVVQRPTGEKRYFSTIDSEIYFGEHYMDDIVKFDYAIEEKKMPIYGFNGYYASRIVVGQKLITGTFAINFTETGMITKILEKISGSVYADKIEELSFVNCSERNHALWDKSFDILIGYGYYQHPVEKTPTYKATCKCLVGCFITGMQEVLDTSGEPIMEVYSFIAKDIIYKNYNEIKSEKEDDSSLDNGKTDSPAAYKIEDMSNGLRVSAMYEYCRNNPSTLGIAVEAQHNIRNKNKPELQMNLAIVDDKPIVIQKARITITDQRVKSAPTMTMEKLKGYTYLYKFKEDEMEISKQINKALLDKDNNKVDCRIELEVLLENGEPLPSGTIKYDLKLHKGIGY